MSDVCLIRKSISLFLGVLPCEFVALYLPTKHDEISTQVVICNGKYKFAAYLYNILHELVDNEVIFSVFIERFPLGLVRKLHIQCINFPQVLMRVASITYDLDIS